MGLALSEVTIPFQGCSSKSQCKCKNKKIRPGEQITEQRFTCICSELKSGIISHWRKESCCGGEWLTIQRTNKPNTLDKLKILKGKTVRLIEDKSEEGLLPKDREGLLNLHRLMKVKR